MAATLAGLMASLTNLATVGWTCFTVFVLLFSGRIEANICSIHNGKCTYHVQLLNDCPDSARLANSLQNDYNQKVTEIEQNLIDVRVDHAKRIIDLENKISVLLGQTDPVFKTPPASAVTTKDNFPDSSKVYDTLKSDPDRKENELLNTLHDEFSILRKELAALRRKLRETQSLLTGSRAKLNKTEKELDQTTKKLLDTENNLEKSQKHNTKLNKDLQNKSRLLGRTKRKLKQFKENIKAKDIELWKLRVDNENLRQELEDCRSELEQVRRMLELALRKYHELNLLHENTTLILNTTITELVVCHKGKTSQFCGFEDPEICGFEQSNETDHLDWTRWSQNTPSLHTGPGADHTCGNKKGYYMYVEATAKGKGQTARLESPKYQGVSEQCVEFYYHMYGSNMGTLNVYTKVDGEQEELPPPIWRAYGNQGDVWTMARLSIREDDSIKGYQVIFEAILETGYQGDIAVDDMRIFDGQCHKFQTFDQIRWTEEQKRLDAAKSKQVDEPDKV